jgi:hypothetical protein
MRIVRCFYVNVAWLKRQFSKIIPLILIPRYCIRLYWLERLIIKQICLLISNSQGCELMLDL